MKGVFLAAVLALATASASVFAAQQYKPEAHFMFIGVIAKPGIYTWRANLTVREAIAEAGGRARGADPDTVFFLMPPDKKRIPAQMNDTVRQDDVLFIPRAAQ